MVMSLSLKSDIAEVSGIGLVYARKLEKIGIKTVKDFLFYFPRHWDDYSKITSISEARAGEQISVKGKIIEIQSRRSRRGVHITEAIISDNTGSAKAIWFNRPFIDRSIKKGSEIYLSGKMEWAFGQLNFVSPSYEETKEAEDELRHTARIVPTYPETSGITSKWIRGKIGMLTKLIYNIRDHLPEDVKKRHNLLDLPAAIRSMHFPESQEELKRAQKRFLYDDLFCLLVSVLSNRKKVRKEKAVAIEYDERVGEKFIQSLPYKLTDAQKKAAWEILKDLGKTNPMNRLLEGDVGSGKTIVAAMAILMTACAGYQVVLLAPTEVLAKQHYLNVKKLFSGNKKIKMTLLTGSTKPAEKSRVIKKIEDGDVQVIIGTHAVLSEKISYWTLALVIVDEQHRFGVSQRMKLKKANGAAQKMPHFLSMSATPIPRTLAITVFGDLDISILDEMPLGRKKVETHIVPPPKRQSGYEFIDRRIGEGRQVFVICPLIKKSDKLGVKSVMEEYDSLTKIFPKRRLGLLHGKLKPAEKEATMKNFREGKINILVSTAIIEVGVDVANASIMVIEGAERFGLAQLHQFRGRVGRGEHKSYCFLFTNSKLEKTIKRLNALMEIDNGFKLSEKDLEIRGPGELLGVKQHGKIDQLMTNILHDSRIIRDAKETAEYFLSSREIEKEPLLFEKIKELDFVAKLE